MTRHISGLSAHDPAHEIATGIYLVRVEQARYHWDRVKPYYVMLFVVIDPPASAGRFVRTRLYASVKALWKLNWFLRDFGYNPELLGADELDEKALIGLEGVLKISHRRHDGRQWLTVDAFAPAETFEHRPESPVAKTEQL